MQKFIKINFIILSLFYIFKINNISIVYNLRISEATRHSTLRKKTGNNDRNSIFAITPDVTLRKRYDDSNERILVGIGTYIYAPDNYYFKTDFAFGNIKYEKEELKFSKTQTDDILFTGGLNKKFSDKVNVTFSGILGIPTHKNFVLLQPLQLGTGHVGIGFQVDGAFSYFSSQSSKSSLLAATRYIHFLPRTLDFSLNNNNLKFDFDLGNLADLYISNQYIWKKNRIEFGYNATFGFGANIQPSIPNINNRQFKLIRNSFFSTFAHGFLMKKHIFALILGFSYSFDSLPKEVGIKRSISLWLSGAINF